MPLGEDVPIVPVNPGEIDQQEIQVGADISEVINVPEKEAIQELKARLFDLDIQIAELRKEQNDLEKLKPRLEFIEEWCKKINENFIIAYRTRIVKLKETDGQLMKDLLFLSTHFMEVSEFVVHGWKVNKCSKGNLSGILKSTTKVEPLRRNRSNRYETPKPIFQNGTKEEDVLEYNHESDPMQMQAFLLDFLKEYEISHIDHLIEGCDINPALEQSQSSSDEEVSVLPKRPRENDPREPFDDREAIQADYSELDQAQLREKCLAKTEEREELTQQIEAIKETIPEKEKKRMQFVETYFKKLNENFIRDYRKRISTGEEVGKQLVKDLLYLAYNCIDFVIFTNNNWKPDMFTRGNIKMILEQGVKNEDVIEYKRSDPKNEKSKIIRVLKLDCRIDHVDHLIAGYDINSALKD